MTQNGRLEAMRERVLDALGELVRAESPSGDLAALAHCAEVLSRVGQDFLGCPPVRRDVDGVPCLQWGSDGAPHIGVIGHLDTVHPLGSLAVNPFRIEDDWAYGPGIFDMKAGIIEGLAALSVVGLDGVTLLVTGDEELGSASSQPLIEELARRVEVVLVLEPSFEGALKTSRKGSVTFDLDVRGKEAHAGLEPHDGVNATIVMAHAAIAIARLADEARGTTVTPTTASSGEAGNIVPGRARLHVDVRAWEPEELERVEAALRNLDPALPGAQIDVIRGPRRVPLEAEQSRLLFELARRVWEREGFGELKEAAVGGGSDGCLTAAVGTPTLDGLGPVGRGAHTPGESIRLSELLPRAALVAGLIDELRARRSAR